MNNINGDLVKTVGRNVTLGGIVLILLYMVWNLGTTNMEALTEEMQMHRQETLENNRQLNDIFREQVQVMGELKTLIELKMR